MQTVLVTLDPRQRSHRRLAWGGWLLVHGLLTGGIVSLMIYPLMFAWPLVLLLMPELWHGLDTPAFDVLIAVSLFNIGAFALAALFSALRGLRAIGKLRLALLLPSLPVYYLLMSLAVWQALAGLWRAPSEWEKTAHGISKKRRTPPSQFRSPDSAKVRAIDALPAESTPIRAKT